MNPTVRGAATGILFGGLPSRATYAAETIWQRLSFEGDSACIEGAAFARLVHDRAPSIELIFSRADDPEVIVALRSKEDGRRFRSRDRDAVWVPRERIGTRRVLRVRLVGAYGNQVPLLGRPLSQSIT